jgi:hypothetical protein
MMMNRCFAPLLVVAATLAVTSCVRVKPPATKPSEAPPGATLWERPADLATRDLFYGPWGREHAPDPNAVYTLVELKHTGVNPGMTVLDPNGREWSVKQPPPGHFDSEAPVEVALSRLLSGIGYHQPPAYILPSFTLKDDWGTHTEPGGRFRPKEKTLDSKGEWSWQDNPFIGTRQLGGLLTLMMMFNSTDLKDSNNTLYHRKIGDRVEVWYVARDLGAALGDRHRLSPRKGDPDAFERMPFIHGVQNGYVQFAYNGWYRRLVRDRVTPADVEWVSNLLGQLSDRQWQDAFRAGGYEPAVANRFIRKLREKVEQGRTLTRAAAAQRSDR